MCVIFKKAALNKTMLVGSILYVVVVVCCVRREQHMAILTSVVGGGRCCRRGPRPGPARGRPLGLPHVGPELEGPDAATFTKYGSLGVARWQATVGLLTKKRQRLKEEKKNHK